MHNRAIALAAVAPATLVAFYFLLGDATVIADCVSGACLVPSLPNYLAGMIAVKGSLLGGAALAYAGLVRGRWIFAFAGSLLILAASVLLVFGGSGFLSAISTALVLVAARDLAPPAGALKIVSRVAGVVFAGIAVILGASAWTSIPGDNALALAFAALAVTILLVVAWATGMPRPRAQ